MIRCKLTPNSNGLPDDTSDFPKDNADRLREIIEMIVCWVYRIDLADLRGPSRGRATVAQARQTAMYLAHVTFSLPLMDVGRIFGRDRTTVSHACSLIEDRRDDAGFDHTLSLMEEIVRHTATISGTVVTDAA